MRDPVKRVVVRISGGGLTSITLGGTAKWKSEKADGLEVRIVGSPPPSSIHAWQ
jgi:hypothetical protein